MKAPSLLLIILYLHHALHHHQLAVSCAPLSRASLSRAPLSRAPLSVNASPHAAPQWVPSSTTLVRTTPAVPTPGKVAASHHATLHASRARPLSLPRRVPYRRGRNGRKWSHLKAHPVLLPGRGTSRTLHRRSKPSPDLRKRRRTLKAHPEEEEEEEAEEVEAEEDASADPQDDAHSAVRASEAEEEAEGEGLEDEDESEESGAEDGEGNEEFEEDADGLDGSDTSSDSDALRDENIEERASDEDVSTTGRSAQDHVRFSKTIRAASQSASRPWPVRREEGSKGVTDKHKGGKPHVLDGTGSTSRDGTNVTQLSSMMLKLIKTLHVKSVADMPCHNNLEWFPKLLQRLDFEVVGFQYYCVDSTNPPHADIRSSFGEAGSPQFLNLGPGEAGKLPKVDLVFSWDGPQKWGVKDTWTFFSSLRLVRPKYLLVTNNPDFMNTSEKLGVLNLRKQPFHFAKPMRVISGVYVGEVRKQLLLYEMDGIRKGF